MAQNIISLLIQALQEMQQMSADDQMIRDIVREQRVPSTEALPRAPTVRVHGAIEVTQGVSLGASERGVAPGNGRGWVEAKAIETWKPPGLSIMDAMMDAEDARWRAERKKEFGQ
jgi:hypothetical protein